MNSGIDKHSNNFNLVRLLAALQVLFVHALNHFDVQGPFVTALKAVPGVPVFFFISGYLICTSYKKSNQRSIGSFFINRFLRIYPGLLICVALSFLAVILTGYFRAKDIAVSQFALWLVSQSTILQFYNPEFMRAFGVGVLNGALWTVSVELQFYFLMPVLFYLAQRRPFLLAAVFVLSLVFNVVVRIYAEDRSMPIKLLGVSFVPWVYMFLFGFMVAYSDRLANQLKRMNVWLLVIAYIASINLIGDYTWNAQNCINPVSFFLLACVIFRLATGQLPIPDRLSKTVNKSDLSYGLYLYHMPVINVLLFVGVFSNNTNIALTAVVSLIAATISWHFVEKPALKLKKY